MGLSFFILLSNIAQNWSITGLYADYNSLKRVAHNFIREIT